MKNKISRKINRLKFLTIIAKQAVHELEDSSETITENAVIITDPVLPRTFLVLALKVPRHRIPSVSGRLVQCVTIDSLSVF